MQIPDLPAASSVSATDVFAIDKGGATMKIPWSTLATQIRNNVGIQYVDGTIAQNNTNANITAPTVEGWTFFCWLSATPTSWTDALTIYVPNAAQTSVWRIQGVGTRSLTFRAFAIYLRT